MFGDHKGALAESERALAMSQNQTIAHETLGIALIYSGRAKEGLVALQRYLRLDPRDPTLALGLLQIAIGHYFCHEYETALDAAERAIRLYPDFPLTYRWLAATLGQLGRTDEARRALEKAIAVAPTSFDFYVRGRAPWFRLEDHAHMLDGLRKAGWREE
jgi:adenylate cyclase